MKFDISSMCCVCDAYFFFYIFFFHVKSESGCDEWDQKQTMTNFHVGGRIAVPAYLDTS
jgi:hypothetical protein